ncbi:hypothetical protein IE53DRAFT_169933 [Violaceomyces palustris]|uniref:Uncharacterized protein n=1 Tax=Violaceomyces palustris TaxID=1673888 RepID=A0ACD0NT02_9BASI|nr:hypothetical protein IE53DRAFT_169933 [Violaceomyces palustris]
MKRKGGRNRAVQALLEKGSCSVDVVGTRFRLRVGEDVVRGGRWMCSLRRGGGWTGSVRGFGFGGRDRRGWRVDGGVGKKEEGGGRLFKE